MFDSRVQFWFVIKELLLLFYSLKISESFQLAQLTKENYALSFVSGDISQLKLKWLLLLSYLE